MTGGRLRTPERIRVVLFDVGGVLVELVGTPMLLSWAGIQLSPDSVWERWLTSPTVRAFETGRISASEFSVRLIREMKLAVKPDELLEQFVKWPRGLYPETLELINSIPERYIKATLSNCNCLHWPRIMNEMGLGEMFDFHFASHLTGKIKPDEDAFMQVIHRTGCSPSEILYLDDNRLNTETAERLEITAVQVNGAKQARDVLLEAGVIPVSRPMAK